MIQLVDDILKIVENRDVRIKVDDFVAALRHQMKKRMPFDRRAGLDDVVLEDPTRPHAREQGRNIEHVIKVVSPR